MNKRVIAITIVVGLSLTALVIGAGLTQTVTNRSTTSTLEPVTNTKSTAGNTSNSFFMAMNVIPTARLVPLGGDANFTVAFYNGGDITGNYSLSVAAPNGLSFEFGPPSSVTMSGCGPCSTNLQVHSSSAMEAGAYNVTIEASGSKGVANQTFDFHVQRNLVLIAGASILSNLTVKAGDTVTWVNLEGQVGGDSLDQIVFLNMTLISDPLPPNASWSYTFTQPGTYRYYDAAHPSVRGEIIVLP
jgi:plastocyanin